MPIQDPEFGVTIRVLLLMKRTHSSFSDLRNAFLDLLFLINNSVVVFKCKALFVYVLAMCNEIYILNLGALYSDDILKGNISLRDTENFSPSTKS